MRISFTITGVIELDDNWGSPTQLQQEIQRDFPEALKERAGQWSGMDTRTHIESFCSTLIQR